MRHLFLDIDRAKPVFSLLFGFVRDEANSDVQGEDFDDTLRDVLVGLRIPSEIKKRLEPIYLEVQTSSLDLANLARETDEILKDQRETVLALISIFLRLSENDGIVCRKASERFVTLVSIFGLKRHELVYLSEHSREILEVMMEQHRIADLEPETGQSLASHYETLGCEPGCTDSELRGAYRKLAKKYHPDTSPKQVVNGEVRVNGHGKSKRQFQQVLNAFQEITKARELTN